MKRQVTTVGKKEEGKETSDGGHPGKSEGERSEKKKTDREKKFWAGARARKKKIRAALRFNGERMEQRCFREK